MRRVCVTVFFLCVTLVMQIPPAAAQESLEVSASPETIAPGDTIDVSGEGCAPNARVTVAAPVTIGGIIVESSADEAGAFSDQITITAEAVEDIDFFQLVVSCPDEANNQQQVSIDIHVEQDGGEEELPITGPDPLMPLLVAFGLGVAGLAFLGLARRIRTKRMVSRPR